MLIHGKLRGYRMGVILERSRGVTVNCWSRQYKKYIIVTCIHSIIKYLAVSEVQIITHLHGERAFSAATKVHDAVLASSV